MKSNHKYKLPPLRRVNLDDSDLERAKELLETMEKWGNMKEECLKKIPLIEREFYSASHTEKFYSACLTQMVTILWGPNSQVVTRFRVNGRKTMLDACWPRRAFTFDQKTILRDEIIDRFNCR